MSRLIEDVILHSLATSDLVQVGQRLFLVMPATDALIDELAALGADAEDVEDDFDNEREAWVERA